jgi:hypothetical protein
MRSIVRGVWQAIGFSGALLLLNGCPKLGADSDADAGSDEAEGSSGSSGQGDSAGTGGDSGSGGVGGTGGAGGEGGAGTGGSDGGSMDKDGGAAAGDPCDGSCQPFQHCELVEVTCIQAPCPPQPECVDNPSCGGFAAFTCPGAGVCEDDPRDECDPENGGADCGGVCVCSAQGGCAPGETWDAESCACVEYAADAGSGDGVACGKNTCEAGQVCCNASCGTCTAPDSACTQVICD